MCDVGSTKPGEERVAPTIRCSRRGARGALCARRSIVASDSYEEDSPLYTKDASHSKTKSFMRRGKPLRAEIGPLAYDLGSFPLEINYFLDSCIVASPIPGMSSKSKRNSFKGSRMVETEDTDSDDETDEKLMDGIPMVKLTKEGKKALRDRSLATGSNH
ncbi:DNA-directed RNA polymerase subunit D [Striga asiatica]|uniref:DNA-directed RNA polymerase subunit D n=1 Tax=Striga asiatica TaxID=4170 RepID=A0A5A7QSC0_STRAF|nr:DNA-directed RNA polymerase subunit D [Striga asiatica]